MFNDYNINRRDFIKSTIAMGIGSSILPSGCLFGNKETGKKKVIVLGIDGMDPHLSDIFMRKGLLPNFKKLAMKGCMSAVATSMPPQSPVAWSNFIVGASTAVHGIYDFIHRDPSTMIPYLSTSSVSAAHKNLKIGDWKIPLSKGETKNLMQGRPFWDYLADRDIPTTLFKMPANFPCENSKIDMVSGMGTPDLRGGYGNFTLFTTVPQNFKKNMSGGRVIPVSFNGQKAVSELSGPVNTLKQGDPEIRIPIKIWRDQHNSVIRLVLQDNELILKQGEWSDWIRIAFPVIGSVSGISGICKLYLKGVYPEFSLYVTPINIDPSDPALPVVSSKRYGQEIVRNVGYFYTQGFPEDTKALSNGVFSEKEYLDLAYQIIDERNRLLDYELKRFAKQKTGLLFFYFSSLDQDSHMYWRTIDPMHPLYNKQLSSEYGKTLRGIYIKMDKMLGRVMNSYDINDPNVCLMVMSDHGFSTFRRQVNLNTWLFRQGYLALNNPDNIESEGYFENVNWAKTGAYNLGINSIYLNREGREKYGKVYDSQSKKLIKNIQRDLMNIIDPKSGQKAVSNVLIMSEQERRLNPQSPDMIVGWNIGYRNSWDSILGAFSKDTISDNLDKWSGDHCIDPALVPAVLFANRRLVRKNPSLCDLSASILDEFNIEIGENMEGRPLFV